MSVDPYAPPKEPAPITLETCPAWGSAMRSGWVRGRLRWTDIDASRLRRILGGKQIVGPRPLTLVLNNGKHAAFQCGSCNLVLMLPQK